MFHIGKITKTSREKAAKIRAGILSQVRSKHPVFINFFNNKEIISARSV